MVSPPNFQATSPLSFSTHTPLFCRSGAPSPWQSSSDSGFRRSHSSPLSQSCYAPVLVSEFRPTSLSPSALTCNRSVPVSPTTEVLDPSPWPISRQTLPEILSPQGLEVSGKASHATPAADEDRRVILTGEEMTQHATTTLQTANMDMEDEAPQREVDLLLDTLTNVHDMAISPGTFKGVSPARWLPSLACASPNQATEAEAVTMLHLQDLSVLPPVFPSSFAATPPSSLFCSPPCYSTSRSEPPMKISQDTLLHSALPSHMPRTGLLADQHLSWSRGWNPLSNSTHLDALTPELPPHKRPRESEHQRWVSSQNAIDATKPPWQSSPAFDQEQARGDLDEMPPSLDPNSIAFGAWPIPTHEEPGKSKRHDDFPHDKIQRLGNSVLEEDAKMSELSKAKIHEGTWVLPSPNWTGAGFNQARQLALNAQRKEELDFSQDEVCRQNQIQNPESDSDPLVVDVKWREPTIGSGNSISGASADVKDTRPDARPFMTFHSSSSEQYQYENSPGSSTSSRYDLRKRKAPPSAFKMRLRSGRNAAATFKSEPNLSIGFRIAADSSPIPEATWLHDQELPAPERDHTQLSSDGLVVATSTLSDRSHVQTVDTKTFGQRPRRRPHHLPVVGPDKSSDCPLAGLTSKMLHNIDLQHLYPRLFAARIACNTSPRRYGKEGASSSSSRAARAAFNPPRSDNDLYTPRWTKGTGREKVGLCPICMPQHELWQKMKCSAYWYHLHYHHGVSAQTGTAFPAPELIEFQDLGFLKSTQNNLRWNKSRLLLSSTVPSNAQRSIDPPVSFAASSDSNKLTREAVQVMISEPELPACLGVLERALMHLDMIPAGLCGNCSKWIPLDSLLRESGGIQEIPWWKHTQQCQKAKAPLVATRSRR